MKVSAADLQYKMNIEVAFPDLVQADYSISSPFDRRYNCIAWVAEDIGNWWWPDAYSYWPQNAPRQVTVSSFQKAFESLGYVKCDSHDFEIGFCKIAFYVDPDGKPTHGARQSDKGIWLSKLGNWPDIEHGSLDGLYSDTYGRAVGLIMRRPVKMHHA